MWETHAHVAWSEGLWRFPAGAVGKWGVRRATNGMLQPRWSCSLCGYRTSTVAHHALQRAGIDIRTMPIDQDNVGMFARCVVRGCDREDVELNHFGPTGVFGDEADKWPTGFLCVDHHREWGERVTPHLSRSRKVS